LTEEQRTRILEAVKERNNLGSDPDTWEAVGEELFGIIDFKVVDHCSNKKKDRPVFGHGGGRLHTFQFCQKCGIDACGYKCCMEEHLANPKSLFEFQGMEALDKWDNKRWKVLPALALLPGRQRRRLRLACQGDALRLEIPADRPGSRPPPRRDWTTEEAHRACPAPPTYPALPMLHETQHRRPLVISPSMLGFAINQVQQN